jgi:hypothetical protein
MKLIIAACVVAALLVASPVFAQIPIGETGNLLVGGAWNTSLGSSDEGLVLQLEADGTILVDENHPVKFFFNQSGNNLAGVTDWMKPGYDDSTWKDGVNGVGYNCIEITSVPDTDDQGAIFIRFKEFDIPNASSITSMTIRADYDDGFIVWLNGVEVVRANMGTEDPVPEWNHKATSHESTNIKGPNPDRWKKPVSNLFGPADDNPSGSIVEYTFDVVFSPVAAVQPAGKLSTLWGAIKQAH